MRVQEKAVARERFLTSGEEAGTAPHDRRFRPDVEGLRAVAILLVVLYHASIPRMTGGYVGVDVFFVISGFVITGLLLRERSGTGGTSILDFYARRCRRILPAATLVILATVLSTYVVLGVGNRQPNRGRWPLGSRLPRQLPLRVDRNELPHCKSSTVALAELLVAVRRGAVLPRLPDAVPRRGERKAARYGTSTARSSTLSVVIVASYWLSVTQTGSNPSARLFLTPDPCLGTRPRRAGRGRHDVVACGSLEKWPQCSLGWASQPSSYGRVRLQRADRLSRVNDRHPSGRCRSDHRGRRRGSQSAGPKLCLQPARSNGSVGARTRFISGTGRS